MTEILDEAAVSEIEATVSNNEPLQGYLRQFGVDIPALCATVKHLRAEARSKKIELLQLSGRGELLAKEHVKFDSLDEVEAARNEFARLRNIVIRDLQSQLERAGHRESEKQLREWQDKVVSLMDRLAQVEQEREALQGEVTFLNDKYLEREAAVIESVRSRAIQLCKDKAAEHRRIADIRTENLNDTGAMLEQVRADTANEIRSELEKL